MPDDSELPKRIPPQPEHWRKLAEQASKGLTGNSARPRVPTWQELAEMIANERDTTRLADLVPQLNAALDQDEQNIAARRNPYLRLRAIPFTDFLKHGVSITAADFGTFQLLDSSRRELRLVTSQGLSSEFTQHFDIVALDNCACGTALKKRSRVVVTDVVTDPVFDDVSRRTLMRANAFSVQSTPLFGKFGELIGIVSTHNSAPRTFSPETLLSLDGMVSEFAAGLRWP